MTTREKVIKKIDCFMFNIEERRDIDIYTLLKNLEIILIDLYTSVQELPDFEIPDSDLESINYHSRSIELIVAKLDDKSNTKDVEKWKTVYDEFIDMFNAMLSVKENSEDEEKLLNICDIIGTIYTKFFIIKNEIREENTLFWTIKYGYETDWGEDIEYLLSILPGIRALITTRG